MASAREVPGGFNTSESSPTPVQPVHASSSTNNRSLSREDSPAEATALPVHATALQIQSGESPPSTAVNSSASPPTMTTPTSVNYSVPSTSSAPVVESRVFADTEKVQYKTTKDGVTVRYTAQGGVSLVYLPPRLRGGIGFISDLLDDLHQPIDESERSDPGPTKLEFLLAWLPASPAENGLESGTNPRSYFVKDPSKPTAQQWGLNPSVLNSLLISVESLQTAIETAEGSASLFARVTPYHIDSDYALRDRMTEQVTRIMVRTIDLLLRDRVQKGLDHLSAYVQLHSTSGSDAAPPTPSLASLSPSLTERRIDAQLEDRYIRSYSRFPASSDEKAQTLISLKANKNRSAVLSRRFPYQDSELITRVEAADEKMKSVLYASNDLFPSPRPVQLPYETPFAPRRSTIIADSSYSVFRRGIPLPAPDFTRVDDSFATTDHGEDNTIVAPVQPPPTARPSNALGVDLANYVGPNTPDADSFVHPLPSACQLTNFRA
ncbi:hypothetical protein DL93DRAFT_2174602 [Clavulina sp. PMI_390]|nr:hypothetical protein DL93DRAFT_2174602 [Clavulina sp. PMI_390]